MPEVKPKPEKLTKDQENRIWGMVSIQHEIEMAFSYLPTDEQGNVEQGDVKDLKDKLKK